MGVRRHGGRWWGEQEGVRNTNEGWDEERCGGDRGCGGRDV